MKLSEQIKTADWQTEKHVPVIECAEAVKTNELFEVKVGIGKEVAHPNTTEHHIRWIALFFQPEAAKAPLQVGHYEFSAHGESIEGANKGPLYTHHQVTAWLKTAKAGTLYALALCNIHGLWQSTKPIKFT